MFLFDNMQNDVGNSETDKIGLFYSRKYSEEGEQRSIGTNEMMAAENKFKASKSQVSNVSVGVDAVSQTKLEKKSIDACSQTRVPPDKLKHKDEQKISAQQYIMNNFGFDIDEAIDMVKEKEEMMDYTDVEIKQNHDKNKNISE